MLQALLTLVFVLAVNFFLFRGLGNPATQLLRGHTGISKQAVKQLEAQLGLDLPFPQQFLHYVKETLQGNFGYSYFYNEPVKDVIGGKIWPTVLLIGSSTIVTIILGVLIGIYQGWKRASKFDVGMLGFTLVTYSMPEFWFGLILIMLLCSGTLRPDALPHRGLLDRRGGPDRVRPLDRRPEPHGAAVLRPGGRLSR